MFTIPALPLPVLTITSEGSSVAGENFTVTCVTSVIAGLVESVTVTTSWTDSGGNAIDQDGATLTSTSDTSVVLQYSPLYTSSAGQYLCTAVVSIPELAIVQQTNSQPFDIIVQSKGNCMFTACNISYLQFNLHLQFHHQPLKLVHLSRMCIFLECLHSYDVP